MTARPGPAERSREWQTSSLRATAFYSGPIDIASVKWWDSVAGQPSESKNIRAAVGHLIEFGAVNDQVLQLQIQPGRIDWVLVAKDSPESDKFTSLGDFVASSKYFTELISKWLPEAVPLNRLAFGTQLVIPTTSPSESIQIIKEILRNVTMNWTNVYDFIFQVNRPLPCKTLPNLGVINRLAKWQTIIRKTIIANLSLQTQPSVTTGEEQAAYCELDISTAAPTEPSMRLPPEHLNALLAELVHHATDIVSKGDVQ